VVERHGNDGSGGAQLVVERLGDDGRFARRWWLDFILKGVTGWFCLYGEAMT
jgi:hypothetical protein